MAKVLDFNTLKRPVLEIVLRDDGHTHVKVSTPTEGLVEELNSLASELEPALKANNAESIEAIYDLAAELINCNLNYVTVTPEELRGKYRMDLESLVIFFGAYTDFLNEITNAKN